MLAITASCGLKRREPEWICYLKSSHVVKTDAIREKRNIISRGPFWKVGTGECK